MTRAVREVPPWVQTGSALAQGLGRYSPQTGEYPSPISVGVTYARDGDYALRDGKAYTRDQGSDALEQVERLLALVEGGTDALVLSSGLAASTAVFQALPAGSRVVVQEVQYFGLTKWLREFGADQGLRIVTVRNGDLNAMRTAVSAEPTALVWIETPANPTWVVTDIAAVAQIANGAGATLCVDNTVPTPVHTNPLLLGAHLVMHSCTKYLNGHDDVVAGALITDGSKPELWRRLTLQRQLAGQLLGGLEAYLLLRGMKSLNARMRVISQSALAIAEHFASHPQVERVAYPGLASDPGHEVAAAQMTGGYSGMMALYIRGGLDVSLRVAKQTALFIPATSLGGTASLIEHRYTFEGGAGSSTPQNLVRLSIGLEEPSDLIADLEGAIDRASSET
jgi:cystathionine gamma-synthase